MEFVNGSVKRKTVRKLGFSSRSKHIFKFLEEKYKENTASSDSNFTDENIFKKGML